MKKSALLLSLLMLPVLAFASSAGPEPFSAINQSMLNMMTGPLATIMSITVVIMGGAMAVMRGDPVPAMGAVAMAAFLHFGPSIIMNMVGGPGVYEDTSSQTADVQPSAVPVAASPVLAASAPHVKAVQAPAPTPVVSSNAPAPVKVATAPVDKAPKPAIADTYIRPHTVPVPSPAEHVETSGKSIGSSDLMKWLGIGGAAIIAGLLGLVVYASRHRKPATHTGYAASQGSPSAAASAFTDPHGFTRSSPSPALNRRTS